MTDLERSWQQLLERPNAGHLVSGASFLPVYVAASSQGLPELWVISKTRILGIDLGASASVREAYRMATNDWLLTITLLDRELTPTFIKLGIDLIERSKDACDQPQAIAQFRAAISDWRRLLRGQTSLGEEATRGLIGELWYGLNVLAPMYGGEMVTVAWERSATTAQDFILPAGVRHEVKAVRPGAKTIKISSAQQLDPNEGQITLAAVELRNATEDETSQGTGVLNLNELVEGISKRLNSAAESRFLTTLSERGYEIGKDYSRISLVATRLTTYAIENGFPSICSSAVPLQVVEVNYSLRLADLEPFVQINQRMESVDGSR